MHIATVGPTHPARGGIARFTTLLVRHLRRRHEVDFYTFSRLYPRCLFPGSTAADPSRETCEEAAVASLDGLRPLSWRRTAGRIASSRPDLLLLQWWTPWWLPLHRTLTARARAAGVPVLALAHQLVEPDASFAEYFLARAALRRCDGIVLLSEEEVGMVRRVLPDTPLRLAALPGLHAPAGEPGDRRAARLGLGLDPEAPLLLFFGFVRRYKGLRHLLEAVARVPGVHLLVAGEFWENEAPYRDLIHRLGLGARVTVRNRYHANEEVADLFAAADALVLPYLAGNQSAVGSSALGHGLPVIATTVGGLAETVADGETGLLVPPADSRRLAEAIRRFFTDRLGPRFRRAIAADNGRLGWAQLVAQVEDLADEVRQRRRHLHGHDDR